MENNPTLEEQPLENSASKYQEEDNIQVVHNWLWYFKPEPIT